MPQYIFVSGFGHGGTTLMASILGSHPDIHLIPYETRWFLWKKLSKTKPLKYANLVDKPYIVEKTPMHVRKIRGIDEILPYSQFVIMIRNPFDVIASQYKRHGDIQKAINRCVQDYEAISNVKNMKNVHIVRYEDLIENTEYVIKKLCDELGILFDAEMLKFYEKKIPWEGVIPQNNDGVGEKNHLKRRAWQAQQPIFDGRGRWRRELTDDQVGLVREYLASAFVELNY